MANQASGGTFASKVRLYLSKLGHDVQPEYQVEAGFSTEHKKLHRFDFGNNKLIAECKFYTWTAGGNIPSAKIAILNEAMLYLHLAPATCQKILFLPRTETRGVVTPRTLAEYYIYSYRHMIPDGVEIWELDDTGDTARRVVG